MQSTAISQKSQASSKTRATESEVLAAFRRGPERLLDGGTSRLAYWKFGQGPDVVMVHGWPLHGATFRRIIPLLADAFTCHVIDLPGAGQSEWDDQTPLDLVSHAKALRRAIGELGLERYALVAHDSGGFVARMLAEDNPRVSGLALGNTEVPNHSPWLVLLYAAIVKLPGGVPLVRNLMRSATVRRSPLGFGGCFEKADYVEGTFYDLFVAPLIESERASAAQLGLLKSLHANTLERLSEIHRRIEAPVRLIWGTEDRFFPLEKARRMLSEFGGRADLVEIPGAKLFAHEDRPEDFARHARAFLLEVGG